MSRRTRGVVVCAVLLLATGCGDGPPVIDAGDLSPAAARACRDLVADLPDTLAGEGSVETTGDSEYGAAWGDPAIVLTCGVGAADLSDIPPCAQVNGVGWLEPADADDPDQQDADVTFTADGYRPRVRLLVPGEYRPEGGPAALAELAGPVKRHLRLVERCR